MYLGQLIAYPIWLYIGISVIAIVRNAWKNMEEQQMLLLLFIFAIKNTDKTQKK